jgi:hypothetical protein
VFFSWSQLRYANVILREKPTITQDDVDTTKFILEGAKTPVAIKGTNPFKKGKVNCHFHNQ